MEEASHLGAHLGNSEIISDFELKSLTRKNIMFMTMKTSKLQATKLISEK